MKRLLNYGLFLALLLISPVQADPASDRKPEPTELLHYHLNVALSDLRSADLVLRTDGSAQVKVTRNETEAHSFQLTADELDAVKALVRATNFFARPAVIPDTGPSHGHETLAVTLEGKRHQVTWGDSRGLFPLSELLGRILQQGMLITDLRKHGSKALFNVRSSLSPRTTARKVLQPRVLREPLELVLRGSDGADDEFVFASGIQALSYVTTPVEYLGFLAAEIERSAEPRRSRLLALAGFSESKPHREAIAPVLLQHLRAGQLQWSKLTSEQKSAFDRVMQSLGEIQHHQAIPTLIALVRERPDESGWAPITLVRLNARAPVEQLLQDPQPQVRIRAAEMLGNMGAYSSRPGEERNQDVRRQVCYQLRTLTAPKLQTLAGNDPSPAVREAAKKALQFISSQELAAP